LVIKETIFCTSSVLENPGSDFIGVFENPDASVCDFIYPLKPIQQVIMESPIKVGRK